jgi:hypothetical protein
MLHYLPPWLRRVIVLCIKACQINRNSSVVHSSQENDEQSASVVTQKQILSSSLPVAPTWWLSNGSPLVIHTSLFRFWSLSLIILQSPSNDPTFATVCVYLFPNLRFYVFFFTILLVCLLLYSHFACSLSTFPHKLLPFKRRLRINSVHLLHFEFQTVYIDFDFAGTKGHVLVIWSFGKELYFKWSSERENTFTRFTDLCVCLYVTQ